MDQGSNQDAEIIAPTGKDVPLSDGTTVTVKPITVGQLPRFVKAIRPAFGALMALTPAASSAGGQKSEGADPSAEAVDALGFMDLLVDHGPTLNAAVALVTGMEVKRIEAMDLADGAALVFALWEVNRDFFVHRVMPLLRR